MELVFSPFTRPTFTRLGAQLRSAFAMETHPQEKWCLSLGSWSGVAVRIHIFFPIFVALAFLFGESQLEKMGSDHLGIMLLGVGVLFFSVLVHELGHWIVARHIGLGIDSVNLFPWGGSHDLYASGLQKRLVFLIAGPCANLFVCLACGVALLAMHSSVPWSVLLDPREPRAAFAEMSRSSILVIVFWVNWLLLLANLLPSMPFDGGHIIRIVTRMFWKKATSFQINYISTTVALVTSISFLLLAWREHDLLTTDKSPMWMALFMLGIVLLFSMRQFPLDDPADDPVGDGTEQSDALALHSEMEGDLDWEDDDLTYEDNETLSQWLRERKDERDRTKRDSEKSDEQQVDAILAQVHKHGLESLNDSERQLLQRVSARYRNRQNEQA